MTATTALVALQHPLDCQVATRRLSLSRRGLPPLSCRYKIAPCHELTSTSQLGPCCSFVLYRLDCLHAGKAEKGKSTDMKTVAKPARQDAAATSAAAKTAPAAASQPVIAPRPRTLSSLRSKPKACVRLDEAFVHPPIASLRSPAALPAGQGVGGVAGKAAGGPAGKAGGTHAAAKQKGPIASSAAAAPGKGGAAGSAGAPSKRCAGSAARSKAWLYARESEAGQSNASRATSHTMPDHIPLCSLASGFALPRVLWRVEVACKVTVSRPRSPRADFILLVIAAAARHRPRAIRRRRARPRPPAWRRTAAVATPPRRAVVAGRRTPAPQLQPLRQRNHARRGRCSVPGTPLRRRRQLLQRIAGGLLLVRLITYRNMAWCTQTSAGKCNPRN